MTSCRRLAAGLLAGWVSVLAHSAWAKDPLTSFVDQLAQCTGARTMTLAVAGFANDEQALSRTEADEARLEVETRLQNLGRIRIAAAADVVRINSLRQGTTGLSGAEAEQQIRNAFSGDASVFFLAANRTETAIRFRLVAIAKQAECKSTSDVIEVTVRRGAGIADIDKVLSAAVDRLIASERDAREINVCPFAAPESRHSACSAALTDRLLLAIDAKSRDPSLVLRDRSLSVRRPPSGICAAGDGISAQGSFDHDRQGQSWMSVEFRKGSQVAAVTGRARISVEGLGCDPVLRPFLDHVAASAPADRGRLDVSAPTFSKGQRLDVRIEAKAAMRLYCWVLAPDESAYVLLPAAGAERGADIAAGTLRYPSGFGLTEIVLQSSFENLFSCFGVTGDLPEALHKTWMSHAPGSGKDVAAMPKEAVHELMTGMRKSGVAIEATTRIVVR